MVKKRTSARMARLVRQWRQSGESQASFARCHQIPGWTFWYWCRKLSDESTTAAADTGASMFVPVRVASDPPAAVVEIVLNSGERLQVSAGATADLVQALITALRSRC
jgi:hypothetical protein